MNKNIKKTLYILIDVETTGTDYINDFVFDVAFILSDGIKMIDTYQSYIYLDEKIIDKTIKELGHVIHIDKNNILNAKTNKDVMYDLLLKFRSLNERYNLRLVGHNVVFDYSMIAFSMSKASSLYKEEFLNIFPKINNIDTLKLARKFFTGYSSYSLTNICNSLKIAGDLIKQRNENKHSALLDTQILFELFKKIQSETQFLFI